MKASKKKEDLKTNTRSRNRSPLKSGKQSDLLVYLLLARLS
jgi:hypothetical protein